MTSVRRAAATLIQRSRLCNFRGLKFASKSSLRPSEPTIFFSSRSLRLQFTNRAFPTRSRPRFARFGRVSGYNSFMPRLEIALLGHPIIRYRESGQAYERIGNRRTDRNCFPRIARKRSTGRTGAGQGDGIGARDRPDVGHLTLPLLLRFFLRLW